MGHNIYDFQSLDLTPTTALQAVRFGDGSVIQVTGVGSVSFHTESGSIMILTDVLYIHPNTHHQYLFGKKDCGRAESCLRKRPMPYLQQR
jgi:hypothetical protein